MLQSLERLRNYGFVPEAIVDVGAHQGWFAQISRQIWADAHIMMIEALEEKREELEATASSLGKCQFEIALLGAHEDAAVPFHVVHGGNPADPIKVGSSKYPELTDWPQEIRRVPQVTLDQLVAKHGRVVDFIKLDVQGAEIDVLRGATETLKAVQMCLLECSIVKYNEGAPLFDDVVVFMKSIGFCLFDILDENRRDGKLLQIDCLFCPTDSKHRLVYVGKAAPYIPFSAS